MTRNATLIFVLSSVLMLAHAPAGAAVERECSVALQAKGGWSQDRKRRVYFMTGLELSRVTRVLKVEFRNIYAVISHGSGLPNVVRIDSVLLGVGREFNEEDFARLFEYDPERLATQLDGEGRNLKWRLRGNAPDC